MSSGGDFEGEGDEANPVVVELIRRVQNTQAFLRMAAIELRRMAEQEAELAVELRHLAQKLEAEADDLAGSDGNDGGSGQSPLDH